MEGGTGGRQLDGAWCLRQSQIRGRPTAWEHKRTDKLLSYITKINLLMSDIYSPQPLQCYHIMCLF